MKALLYIGFGLGLMLIESAVSAVASLHPFAPNLILPFAIFMGVTHEVGVARGSIVAFVLGYVLDLSCGGLIGLQTFVMVATFVLSRLAGLRLILRGPSFQIILTFVISLVGGGAILALRGIFEPAPPFPTDDTMGTVLELLFPAIATGLCAPLLFPVLRRIEGGLKRTGEAEARPA